MRVIIYWSLVTQSWRIERRNHSQALGETADCPRTWRVRDQMELVRVEPREWRS